QMAAVARVFGAPSRYLIVPLLGAASIWMAFVIARRVARPEIACLAALVIACNPTFLFQLVQPMSDVPAAAWWLACLGLLFDSSSSAALAAGAAASLAILVRPNTTPMMLGVLLFIWLGPETTSARFKRGAITLVAMLPGVLVTAWANNVFFGSPLQSG